MAQISLRIDDDVKRNAEQVCKDIGMSMSTAINIYLKKLGRERRIPFDVVADPFYSPENTAILERRIADMRAGRNVSQHELIEVDE
ncbi:addiction module antitoxin, RelB/DinJ family [Selenomonas sp. FOBRC6]|uniref:type II toxin-antitoxin system RelB/DinJ family antitoxin n=1 Tax=Selenomonas sp. FOBRC6 TaxID=936572 RepID=UPI00027819AE|nr:type II toxin-antitoxin system RelB/DinJ family antitoxin [Selenomonas sp. FOBRC6]EJO22719.1 addiction module antitoxin, RelB/DinJ family [Selenomonas sp. FOBRC6]